MTALHELGERLLGTWSLKADHHLMADKPTGTTTFEWMPGERFLIWRTAFDHPDLPDALSVLGETEGLRLHYFDVRGVHRLYAVTVTGDGWAYEMGRQPGGGFGQRLEWAFEGPEAMSARGYLTHDGVTWEDDIVITCRRAT